jgi:hypothetical protein
MARLYSMICAALLAFGAYGDGSALAQPTPNATATPANQAATPPDDAEGDHQTFPVFAVSSVEILRSTHEPVTDVIVVNGLTSADGWASGELIPLRHGVSSDGVLDLIFVAQAPQESAEPTGYVPIQAIMPLTTNHPFKAVRVRGATNSVLVHDLPGFAETKRPVDPCNPCVGKVLVGQKDTAPAGTASTDIVKEADLPKNTRVVHQDDGIADTRPDPNRLTIIIGEDGRINDAAWE